MYHQGRQQWRINKREDRNLNQFRVRSIVIITILGRISITKAAIAMILQICMSWIGSSMMECLHPLRITGQIGRCIIISWTRIIMRVAATREIIRWWISINSIIRVIPVVIGKGRRIVIITVTNGSRISLPSWNLDCNTNNPSKSSFRSFKKRRTQRCSTRNFRFRMLAKRRRNWMS